MVLVERTPTTNARPSEATTHAPGGFGAYEYDGAGNVTTLGSDSFVYDAFGRIHTATVSGSTQTFTYDRHGNITNITTTGPSGTSARPIAVGTGNRLSGATYDGSGNLLSYHGGTFLYDGFNMVTEWTPTGGGNRHVYIYTADNERIATVEVLPDGTRRTDWTIRDMDGNVLRRYRTHPNGAWSWEEDYIYRGSQLLAAEVPTPEKVRHFDVDHLGTPRLITGNGGGKLVERAYGAFGEAFTGNASQQVTPAPNEPVQFTGHERDNFQRDYMHARYYDPLMGRFLSVDPGDDADESNPQTWNKYAYVRNNPLNASDPTGMFTMVIEVMAANPAPSASMNLWLLRHGATYQLDRWNANVERVGKWFQRWGDIYEFAGRTVDPDCGDRSACQDAFLLVGGVYGGGGHVGALKAVNLPAWRNITINMSHIVARHTVGGAQTCARATKFIGMTERQIERVIRQAYRNGRAVGTQGDSVRVVGEHGGLTIEMWVNKVTRTIETAYPIL